MGLGYPEPTAASYCRALSRVILTVASQALRVSHHLQSNCIWCGFSNILLSLSDGQNSLRGGIRRLSADHPQQEWPEPCYQVVGFDCEDYLSEYNF